MDVAVAVVALKAKVRAAQEEIRIAIEFHEVWKPTAYDDNLHQRMGRSRATNTFLTIRMALRREMLLALMRLWDRNSDAVGMVSIANALKDKRVLEALVAECEAIWIDQSVYSFGDGESFSPDIQARVEEYCKQDALHFARKQSAFLKSNVSEAISIISNYVEGGSRYATLKHLKDVRNERLAHRQIVPSKASVSPTDIKIEDFYQDMLILIHKLLLAVENTHYDPNETAEVRRRQAELFWKTPRGECDASHPDYKKPI